MIYSLIVNCYPIFPILFFLQTPRSERPKVCFPANCLDTTHYVQDSHRSFGDKSFLGYDWIAGILDNENENLPDSDKLIEEINEFRRVNRDECTSNRTVLHSWFVISFKYISFSIYLYVLAKKN